MASNGMATLKRHKGSETCGLEQLHGRMLCAPTEGTEMSLMWCADATRGVCNDVTCVMLGVVNCFRCYLFPVVLV